MVILGLSIEHFHSRSAASTHANLLPIEDRVDMIGLVLAGIMNGHAKYSLLSTTPSKVSLSAQLKFTLAFSSYRFSRSLAGELAHKSIAYEILFSQIQRESKPWQM